jgi:hypothetical protein
MGHKWDNSEKATTINYNKLETIKPPRCVNTMEALTITNLKWRFGMGIQKHITPWKLVV